MIMIRYFCSGSEILPKEIEFHEGMTIRKIITDNRKSLSTMVEVSLDELTFVLNKKSVSQDTVLSDRDELYIFKPTFGG